MSLSLGNGNDEIHAVAPLRDGRFLVAGQTVGPNSHTTGHSPNLMVARFLADGRRDPAFGSGCVKITPGHDFNDYEVGRRHGLPLINIFTADAVLNDQEPPVTGLDGRKALEIIVAAYRSGEQGQPMELPLAS